MGRTERSCQLLGINLTRLGGAAQSCGTSTHLYDTCWPPVYTALLFHAATAAQLVPVGDDPGALLLAVPEPTHALTVKQKKEAKKSAGMSKR